MTPTSERKGTKKACKMCRTGELEDAPSSKQQKTPWEGYCPGALGCRWTWPGHHDKPDSGSQEEGGGHPRQHNCRNIQTTGLMTRTKVWMKGKEKTAERLEEELRNMVDHHIQKIKI
ncbi:hypothetical protein BgiMline_034588 [Biomphalaria glabrata]|nr:hypothetical protein BgiMline_020732 [Biomphalaria glabrata]